MDIEKFESSLLFSNMYLIIEKERAIVINPFQDVKIVNDLKVNRIILTHEHYDHISGVNAWKAETKAKVLCSATCAKNTQSSRKKHGAVV